MISMRKHPQRRINRMWKMRTKIILHRLHNLHQHHHLHHHLLQSQNRFKSLNLHQHLLQRQKHRTKFQNQNHKTQFQSQKFQNQKHQNQTLFQSQKFQNQKHQIQNQSLSLRKNTHYKKPNTNAAMCLLRVHSSARTLKTLSTDVKTQLKVSVLQIAYRKVA